MTSYKPFISSLKVASSRSIRSNDARLRVSCTPKTGQLRYSSCVVAQHQQQPRDASSRRHVIALITSIGLTSVWSRSPLHADESPSDNTTPPLPTETNNPQPSTSDSTAVAEAPPSSSTTTKAPLDTGDLSEEASKQLLEEEEERRKARRRGKGRLRELEEIRAELAEKQLVLLQKQQELLAQEQTVMVLREELELERKLRALLTKEKEKAEEEAALAMGLCGSGGSMLP